MYVLILLYMCPHTTMYASSIHYVCVLILLYRVERTFRLDRPDSWVINRKTKRIILLEFNRTSDASETYYSGMSELSETHHILILRGLNALVGDRDWEVVVLPLVAEVGQGKGVVGRPGP